MAAQSAPAQPSPTSPAASVTLPAGTKIELVVTRPEWAQSAKDGDTIYAQTSFPVVAGGSMAIPAGTYVQGTIESVTKPTRKVSHAVIEVLFTKIIFADGYTVETCPAEQPGFRRRPCRASLSSRSPFRNQRRTICCSITAPKWR